MQKTRKLPVDGRLAVSDQELADMLGVSRNTAAKIGAAAGAVFYVGRRKLNRKDKVERYLDMLGGATDGKE